MGLLGLTDKKALELGVPSFAALCIAHSDSIYRPEALREWDRNAMFTCWQFSSAESHCMLPLGITEHFTNLISLIFRDRDVAVKGGVLPAQVGNTISGAVQRERLFRGCGYLNPQHYTD